MPNGIYEYQGYTPPGYATPEQIKAQQDYAKALMTGSGQQPVHHWTQGVSNMVAALAGRNLYDRANQEQIQANQLSAGAVPAIPSSGTPATQSSPPQQKTSFSEGPASEGQTNSDASSSPIMDKYAKATSSQESGGDYSAIGPVTHNGDRALGKYQVMASNVPQWTQTILGKAMTPEEFLNNKEAQEAVYKAKFGEYVQKYGPEGAAKAWFAGEKGMNHPEYKDINGTTVAGYGQKFTALAGPDAVPPGVAAINAAAGGTPAERTPDGGTQVAANGAKPPSPSALPDPSGGKIYVDPSLAPRVPRISQEQMQTIMFSNMPQSTKDQYMQMYLQQGQPVSVPYPGGKVLIDPMNPTRQQFIPDSHWGAKEIGPNGIKRDEFQTAPMPGQSTAPPATMPAGPRSEATPGAAPQTPAGGPAVGTPPVAQNAPVATPSPAIAPQAAPAQGVPAPAASPVRVASTDPSAGIAAAGAVPKALSQPAVPSPAPIPATAPEPSPEQTAVTQKVAGALGKAPPGVSPEDWDTINAFKDMANQKALELKKGEADVDIAKDNETHQTAAGWKNYENQKAASNSSRDLLENVTTAQGLMNDPRLHTGILSGAQDVWSRLKEAFGEKAANAPNELFDKLASGAVLGALRPTLQGTGQVRLMEVQLLQKANASRYYGDAANRAVLEISRRALSKQAEIGKMADQYVQGQDVTDSDGHVLLPAGQGKRHGLDAGFNQIANKWIETQNEKDTKYFQDTEKLFTTGMTPEGKKLYERPESDSEVPPNPQPGQTWTFTSKKTGKPVVGVFDGKNWVPKQDQPQQPTPEISK